VKPENEKKYLIGVDEGYCRKIAFIDKNSTDFADRNLAKVMKYVEQAGNEEKFRGFYATTPTIYTYMDNFQEVIWDGYYRHQGSLYEKHECSHKDIIVYCHIRKLDEYEAGSAAAGKFIKDLMSAFPPKRN
jgi:hypothetical protein